VQSLVVISSGNIYGCIKMPVSYRNLGDHYNSLHCHADVINVHASGKPTINLRSLRFKVLSDDVLDSTDDGEANVSPAGLNQKL